MVKRACSLYRRFEHYCFIYLVSILRRAHVVAAGKHDHISKFLVIKLIFLSRDPKREVFKRAMLPGRRPHMEVEQPRPERDLTYT